MDFLDRHENDIRRRSSNRSGEESSTSVANTQLLLHVWTDSPPSDSPSFLDSVEEDEGVGGGRGKMARKMRSASVDDGIPTIAAKGRKARGRSGSFQDQGSKKKVHPRSHQTDATPFEEANSQFAPLLCKSHFFSGKCSDAQKSGKKGGCRCVHFNNKQMKTLSTILTGSSKKKAEITPNNSQDILAQAEEACFVVDESPGSMDLVYYLTIPVPSSLGESATDEEIKYHEDTAVSDSIGELISEKLSASACSIASIVYLVISSPFKHVLVYDRNQDGLVVKDFPSEVLGSGAFENTSNAGEENPHLTQAQHLPVSILEHILAYVEASGVAAASKVCTAWRREIAHASPNLWRHLLKQRNWPFPKDLIVDNPDGSIASLQDIERSERTAKVLKDKFIQHYSVLRDMRAIQSGLLTLLTSKKASEEREMTYQAFSARRDAPQAPNNCVAVEVWGPNQVLAAYSNDCTLRLFQAVPRAGSLVESGNSGPIEKSCKELVCQSIDPYMNTKKKSCFMEAMGLDDDVVGCLLNVSDYTHECKSPHILVILKRDDLLIADVSSDTSGKFSAKEEGSLRVIDVEEAVLNYILSLDHVDHRLLRLHDFLALGGDEEEVEVIVSQSMSAVGYGRFMIECAISIPFPEDDNNNDDDLLLLDRKLFLFSSSVGAIVWMGDSNPPNEAPRPRLEDMTLTCLRRPLPGSLARSCCCVTAVSQAFAPFVMSCEIDHSGYIDGNFALGSALWSQGERLHLAEEGWTLRLDGPRPTVLAPTDVVVGDTLTRVPAQNSNERQYKSALTFYSRFDNDSISKLVIGENCMIDRMVGVRDDYCVVIARFFTESGFPAEQTGGHWGNELDRGARVFAITVHVPSRREIERLCLYEDFGWNRLSLAAFGDTVACGVWLKGILITGADVYSITPENNKKFVTVLDDASGSNKAFKKKTKKRRSKGTGSKKDGFARGQSLRG